MKSKRDNVYIWITWLTKLIAGEQQCEFQAWFKAHYKHDKVSSGNFHLTKWTIEHNNLVHKSRDEFEADGYKVTIEDQNSFRLRRPGNVTVSGKADIVALADGRKALVVDCKTGKCKNSDQVQVLLYMIILPMSIERYEDIEFDGLVIYKDGEVPISSTDVDEDLKKVVFDLIDRISGDEPLRKTPSANECKFCDISKDDCPERVE
jgi:CRISPR/Cas system-associated exonuclease Cas4 (RecB family)